MALDREAMRLVADLLQQVQARMIGRQVQRLVAIGEDDVLLARPCARVLWRCRSAASVQPLLGQHLGGDADLPLAAVDHQQIGRRILAGTIRAQRRDSASRIAA